MDREMDREGGGETYLNTQRERERSLEGSCHDLHTRALACAEAKPSRAGCQAVWSSEHCGGIQFTNLFLFKSFQYLSFLHSSFHAFHSFHSFHSSSFHSNSIRIQSLSLPFALSFPFPFLQFVFDFVPHCFTIHSCPLLSSHISDAL